MSGIRADYLVLPDGTLVQGGGVAFDDAGLVTAVGGAAAGAPLPGRVLLPGCVNAHSHVFQRLLRGRVQRATAGRDSFWSWRGQMYALAERLDPDALYDAARFGFYEMLLAGFTAVGEFHYLHHRPGGTPYGNPNELGLAVLRAAADVGIRITLLDVFYERVTDPIQRRFADPSPTAWLERVEDLAAAQPGAPIGVAPHSLRAVTREGAEMAARWAERARARLHLHVSEQPGENEAVIAEHGTTPTGLLADIGALGPAFTAVHATHVTTEDVRSLGDSGSNVCVCPTTERDLGDGITPASRLTAGGAGIALGSDSHALIDPFEEARAVELDERLVSGTRVVHRDADGRSGPLLLGWLTSGGARSLGLPSPLAVGSPADLVALDLAHVSLRGWTEETLLDHVLYAASPAAVTDVYVGGRHLIADRHHADERAILAAFDRLAHALA